MRWSIVDGWRHVHDANRPSTWASSIEACGLLNSAELDELAESLLSDEVAVEFPLAWVSERWVEIDPADGTTRAVTVDDER